MGDHGDPWRIYRIFFFYKKLDVLSTSTYIETQDVPLAPHMNRSRADVDVDVGACRIRLWTSNDHTGLGAKPLIG
ncbi:hypothetical protein ABH944_002363 [Caballeronia udeis]|jgi:hypothetical protein|uniref:Uncharacterized protein n=1 Tax=Caballeronia udeis TaxID=1232866 RepID=A0ABW8MUZ6_9BURK